MAHAQRWRQMRGAKLLRNLQLAIHNQSAHLLAGSSSRWAPQTRPGRPPSRVGAMAAHGTTQASTSSRPSSPTRAALDVSPALPARVQCEEVPQVPAMLTAGEGHGGTCPRPSIKGLRDFSPKIIRPAPPSGPPIGSHRGRVWVCVRRCLEPVTARRAANQATFCQTTLTTLILPSAGKG